MSAPHERDRLGALPLATGLVLGTLAAVRLAQALPRVVNRDALVWDAARRALLDLQAADALRTGSVPSFLWFVAGPETWPTLRLAMAAPLHAIAGPGRAWSVEHGLSIAAFAALPFALALFAGAVGASAGVATLVTLVSTAILAGNAALLTHAANGMLEPLSALLTLGAVTAWIGAREGRIERPWAVALLGNLLFHVKWQHGLLLCVAVLCVELGEGGLRRASGTLAAGARALAVEARTGTGRLLLLATAVLALATVAVGITGGMDGVIAGARVTVRDAHGPMAFAALAAFSFVERAAWRRRELLRASVPPRLRFWWAWLATPMAAWLVVPFTWRLRTLATTAGSYDSGEAPATIAGRLLFYPRAIWETWTPPEMHGPFAALLAATAVAAWLVPVVRRRLAPVAALALVEWLVLSLASRNNYQARFILNLAPLAAGAAAAWIPAIPRPGARIVLGGCAGAVAVAIAAPSWRTDALAAALAAGFDPVDRGDACRRIAEALPPRAVLINDAPASHRQACALWAAVVARERGAALAFDTRPREGWDTVQLMGCATMPSPQPRDEVLHAGPICAVRRRVVRAGAER